MAHQRDLDHESRMKLASTTFGDSPFESLLVNEGDRVQHSPPTDHIVEDLLTIIMKRSTIEPLGVQHTSMVTKVIEGYGRLKRELAGTELRISEAKQRRERQKNDFQTLAKEWARQEETYKAEIKRLELLLLKQAPEKGVEIVSLARSGSLLGKGASRKPRTQNDNPAPKCSFAAQVNGDKRLCSGIPSTTSHPSRGGHDHRSILSRRRNLDPSSDVALSYQINSMRPSCRIQGILGRSDNVTGDRRVVTAAGTINNVDNASPGSCSSTSSECDNDHLNSTVSVSFAIPLRKPPFET